MSLEVKTRLDFDQLKTYMRVMEKGARYLATDQAAIMDESALDVAIDTLTGALTELFAGCVTGDLETRLVQIFDDKVVPNSQNFSVIYSVVKNVKEILDLRNKFLDQVAKLPSMQKDRFAGFLNLHAAVVKQLKKMYPIHLEQCPLFLRPKIGRILDSAYRIE